jgi:hypothetical protein
MIGEEEGNEASITRGRKSESYASPTDRLLELRFNQLSQLSSSYK